MKEGLTPVDPAWQGITVTLPRTVLPVCARFGCTHTPSFYSSLHHRGFCSDTCYDDVNLRGAPMNQEAIPVTPAAIKALAARYKYQNDRLSKAAEDGDPKMLDLATQALGRIEEEAINLGLRLTDLTATDTRGVVVTNNKVTPSNPTVAPPKVKVKLTRAQRDQAKVEARAQAIAEEKKVQGTANVRREPKVKAAQELRPCLDGCGTLVAKNFHMGHDAKLKAMILKVERGEEEVSVIPEVAQDLVKFKRGEKEEIRDSKGKLIETKQTWICTAAPVRFPGRTDIQFTSR